MVVSRADRLAEIGHEDVERAVGSQRRAQFPERLPAGAAGPQQGRPGRARQPQRAGRPRCPKFARALAGVEQASREVKKPAGRFSLFGTRKGSSGEESRVMTSLFGGPTMPVGRGDARSPQYQELKARIHQELLEPPQPRAAARGSSARRPSRRSASLIVGMLERESADDAAQPLRARKPDHRRPERAVRPRSARGAAAGPGHLRHPGQPLRPGLHRARTASSRRPTSCSRTTRI